MLTGFQTALFAINAATVLGIVRSDDALKGRHGHGMALLIAASYGAMLFNSIAALASLLVIDRLRGVEFYEAGNKARRTGEGNVPKGFSSWDLLADYGARRHVRWMLIQCASFFYQLSHNWTDCLELRGSLLIYRGVFDADATHCVHVAQRRFRAEPHLYRAGRCRMCGAVFHAYYR